MITLDEAAIRAKVIELLDGRNATRLDLWLMSGVETGVIDYPLAERVMIEEIAKRSPEVRAYWASPCNCDGHLN